MSKKTQTMSIQGAAEILGVHENTIRNWISAGRVRHVAMGANRLPVAADIMAMVTEFPESDSAAIADQLEPIAASFENRAKILRNLIDRLRAEEEI